MQERRRGREGCRDRRNADAGIVCYTDQIREVRSAQRTHLSTAAYDCSCNGTFGDNARAADASVSRQGAE